MAWPGRGRECNVGRGFAASKPEILDCFPVARHSFDIPPEFVAAQPKARTIPRLEKFNPEGSKAGSRAVFAIAENGLGAI